MLANSEYFWKMYVALTCQGEEKMPDFMEDHMVVRRPDERLSFIPAKYMDRGYVAEPSTSCIAYMPIWI